MVLKATAWNMATKLVIDPNKTTAMKQVREALRAIDRQDLATYPFSVSAVSALLDKDPKTLHDARKSREEMLDQKKVIPPLWLESIPFAGTHSAATYMALDLVEYLNRLALAPTLRLWEQALPKSYPKLDLPRSFLGFQNWLAHAETTELWPFSIQPDGRPLDVIAAILCDTVGDDVRWLTIREFGDLAANTASQAFHGGEKVVFVSEIATPAADEPIIGEDQRDHRHKHDGSL